MDRPAGRVRGTPPVVWGDGLGKGSLGRLRGEDFSWVTSRFFGTQNLFDKAYNSNVCIDAAGGQCFEPAPDFNVYGGLAAT
jgi:hypothetical protein